MFKKLTKHLIINQVDNKISTANAPCTQIYEHVGLVILFLTNSTHRYSFTLTFKMTMSKDLKV